MYLKTKGISVVFVNPIQEYFWTNVMFFQFAIIVCKIRLQNFLISWVKKAALIKSDAKCFATHS